MGEGVCCWQTGTDSEGSEAGRLGNGLVIGDIVNRRLIHGRAQVAGERDRRCDIVASLRAAQAVCLRWQCDRRRASV